MAEDLENTIDPNKVPPLPKGYEPIKKEDEIPPLPAGYTPVKKKGSSVSTSTTVPSSSGLDGRTVSSGTSKNNGFPEIDTNTVAPGMGIQPEPKSAKKEVKGEIVDLNIEKPKTRGFGSEVFHKLATGSAQLGADIAAVPELIYDAFAAPQNAIADYLDIPSLKSDSEKFKKTVGVRNVVKDIYKDEVSKLREESAKVDKKYAAGIYDSFKNGDIADGFRQLTNSFAESLPATSSIMLGGAYAKAPQLLAASTMVFGSGKSEQLKEENPEMSTNARVANALASGLAEGAFETIGSGSIGAAAKGLIEREGTKKASLILKDGLVDFYKEALKKNPLTASMTGEGLEEWATQVTQNSIDVATGAKAPDYNVFEGAADAFISGVFGGAVLGGGLKGIDKIINVQDRKQIKANTNTVFSLQEELNNPNLNETSQAEINKTIDNLVSKNQELIQDGISRVESLSPSLKSKLEESISNIENIKNRAKEIQLDNTSEETKKVLLDNLKTEAKEAYELRNSILEGKATEVDVLPLKEQEKLKKEALKELTAELNPDGSKNITIDDKQITDRANKIYSKQLKDAENSETIDTGATETKSQAEVQEQESESKAVLPTVEEVDLSVLQNDIMGDEKKSEKEFDLYHTSSNTNLTIDDISVEPRQTRQGKKGQYGGLYTYDNIEDIDSFSKGNVTSDNYGIKLNEGVEITDYSGPIERLDKDKLQELRDKGIQVIRGKSIFGKTEIIVIDKSAIKNIVNLNEGKKKPDTIDDGNIQSGVNTVEEVRVAEQQGPTGESISETVDSGEGKIDVKVTDIDYAKDQIEKGVLQWNSDMGAERVNLGISWADIRKGQKDILSGKENTVPAKRLIEALKTAKDNGGYEYVQGSGNQMQKQFVSLEDIQRVSNEENLTDAEIEIINTNQESLAKEHEDYFNSLDEISQQEILENYENRENQPESIQPDTERGQGKNDVPNKKETGTGKKPTAKERIKVANAKIDDISNALKGIDSIFGIKIKVDEIDGLNKNGIDIIDVIAKVAKQAVAAGINIDEAISKTIEHLKKTIDFDVDIDAVKERINPKKETEGFERKPGKKSLLRRLIEGGNSDEITQSLKKIGEDYDIRNQNEANKFANIFIDTVGIAEALNAAEKGLIKKNDIKYLVYAEGLKRLKNEIDKESNLKYREELINKYHELSNTFDEDARDAGQGLAILKYIYDNDQQRKYSLSKMIADYKKNDINGEIPADVKAKFEALEKELKDVEARTKEAEKRAKKAEEALAVQNVKEDIERKKQLVNRNKSGLTPKEQSRKKELKNKFFGRLNDATGLIAMLADPEFREYLGLTFKQAKGDLNNFSKRILTELGKGAKEHLPQLFQEGEKSLQSITDTKKTITIDKDGKITIPSQMFRDYVEAGETDIDVIAAKIKKEIADEYPDVEIRDIRDALTGYGKQINPNKDEITAKINKLKEYGRLLSAFEDVKNGKMPKKSGLKRMKPEQQSRELRKEINRLAKELELETVDLEAQWATAIDRVKSSLKNQIEELDKQIANGEKPKVERSSIKMDAEAESLKSIRDEKRKILDDLVGKPELTEAQRIAKTESNLEKSIAKLQEELDANQIEFKEKPTPVVSEKINALKEIKKALLDTRKKLREEAGLIDEQKLKTAKTRIKNQIEELQSKIDNRDFSKKEVKPILADNELNSLRAEKEKIYEEYEKLKYTQELQNRTFGRKLADAFLEMGGLTRAIKASLDLGLIGIQLRGFTYSELLRNPKELGRKFIKLFGAIGSQSKTNKAMSNLVGHPLYSLAKKLDIGITHPDLRNEVREEMASGNLLHVAWSLPIIAAENLGAKGFTQSKRESIGDAFVNSLKKQYNKLFKNAQLAIKEKEKFTVAEQWKNINAFEAVERGLSTYGNQLRFEEFVRGVERLRAEGKDEINHIEDYKLLASYIRTFSGRAKPAGFEMNQKALNVFFFSFKNAVSVFQQLNPFYYASLQMNSTDFKNGDYTKVSVANKMALATMFKSVVSTSATILFLMAAYNAFKDDDDEEMTLERDPRSSDFGKIKVGNLRYDPWGGYIPLITLYARLGSEEVKKADGSVYKFGEENFGIKDRLDAITRFLINKESPGFQMVHKYLTSTEDLDKETGEVTRVDQFGKKLSENDAYSFYPIFIGSVKEAMEDDADGLQSFLTAYSILGLGNVQKYEESSKSKSGGKKGKSFGPKTPSLPKPPNVPN